MTRRLLRFLSISAAFVFALCALADQASAEIQTINFSAKIGPGALPIPNLRAGDVIRGSFSYDDSAPDEDSGPIGIYPLTSARITLTIHTTSGSAPLTITTTGPDHGEISVGGRIAVNMKLPMPDASDGTFIELSDDGYVTTDSISEVTRVARLGVFATEFFDPSLFMLFTGDGPWGTCEPSCPFEEAYAALTEFSLQPQTLCPIDGESPPACKCVRDEGLREFRCAFLDPSFLAISRIPWPIAPGRDYILNWDILPLTELEGPITLQLRGANIAKPIGLSFIGKNRKAVENRKVALRAPEKPTDLQGTTTLTYQGKSWKIDTTIRAEQFSKIEHSKERLNPAQEQDRQLPKPKQ